MTKKNNTIWLTKDGEYVELKDMKDNHLRNVIAYLERHPEWRETMLIPMKAELDRRTKILPTRDSIDDLFEPRIE